MNVFSGIEISKAQVIGISWMLWIFARRRLVSCKSANDLSKAAWLISESHRKIGRIWQHNACVVCIEYCVYACVSAVVHASACMNLNPWICVRKCTSPRDTVIGTLLLISALLDYTRCRLCVNVLHVLQISYTLHTLHTNCRNTKLNFSPFLSLSKTIITIFLNKTCWNTKSSVLVNNKTLYQSYQILKDKKNTIISTIFV